MLGQGHDVRVYVTKIRVVLNDLDRVRTCPGHETGPRWTADRLLTVGPLKEQTLLCQSVEIRRNRKLRAITAQFRAQIVNGNKQDIGPGCSMADVGHCEAK